MSTLHIPPPANLPPGSPVDAYLRDSGGEGQDRSVPRQLDEVHSYCQKYGLELCQVYQDIARSAGSTVGRDDFNRMIDRIEKGGDLPRGLLLWNYARFSRNANDAVYYLALIEKQGVVVHSLTDQIPDGDYRDLIRYMIHMSNEEKRRQTSRDVKSQLHRLLDETRAMYGVPPRGFMREPLAPVRNERTGKLRTLHRWVPDPEVAPRVLQAFEMRLRGATLRQIAQATLLYKSNNCYSTFWTNKLYKGVLEFGGREIDGYCDPIVPPELWDAVNANLHRVRPGNGIDDPRRRASSFILSGLVHCQVCGSPLFGHPVRQWDYYACTRRYRKRDCNARQIPREPLERGIMSALLDQALTYENLIGLQSKMKMDYARALDVTRTERLTLDRRLATVKRSLTNLTDAVAAHGYSSALGKELVKLETEEIEMRSRLIELERQTRRPPEVTSPNLRQLSEALIHIAEHGTPDEQRDLLRSIVTYIIARRDDASVHTVMYYMPPQQIINLPDNGEGLGLRVSAPIGSITDNLITIDIPVRRHKAPVPIGLEGK